MNEPASFTAAISAAERRALEEDGYLVWADAFSARLLRALRGATGRLYRAEGKRAGAEFKQEPGVLRLANLVNKGDVFADLIVQPRVLAYVRSVLGPAIKLSSVNARMAPPHSRSRQPLHADMGAVPDSRGYWVCNTVWLLDDFTRENGTLRVVPGTHRAGALPQDALADPWAAHADERLLTARAGSIVVLNAHLWHGATDNRTGLPRRAVHVFYTRRDKPQQQYQQALLDADVQARLRPEIREMLALDDPLNDRLAQAAATPRSGFLK